MAIQWYPGHMHKASKEMKKILPQVDLIIEVLDARIPFSSQNPMLAELRGDKPCIKVLNKIDLADPELTALWQSHLEQDINVKTLTMNAQHNDRIADLIALALSMVPSKVQSVKNVQTMIMGIPNVGKSTLINSLAGRQIAKTGNEPAITKMQQRIKLDKGIVLHDTPGVLWPNLENPHSGYRLAITGAIKETAIDNDDIALYAVEYLLDAYPDLLKQRFGLSEIPESGMDALEVIGTKRGCLRSGGRVDLERVAKIILTEIRAGTLGLISWEKPDMIEREWAEVLVVREQKAAKKAARKQRRQPQR
ncbi:50S ribosomal subunit maturation GTPase RbgA [Methylophaga thiooxydans]|uniref:Ribosome biogenesis GTPase A n=1 Tax=Methylophaga thiooxydans TaxID=392484 RepID=A0A0A0BD07_9GAMM|nr:ribosome biogenesis GTPase YlqF [Methylophaga thiooxydans]KGM05821.1 50S ribosomal subunit maturation GTPase RbgA [Methylophaga thiooxydans]